MEAIRIGRRGLGRPRQRPGRAMGDKAYSPAANRAWVLAAQPWHQSGHPVKEGQKKHRRSRGFTYGRCPRPGVALARAIRMATPRRAQGVTSVRGG